MLTTLGDAIAILKLRRWGIAWNVEEEGSGGQVTKVAHSGGLHVGLGTRVGVRLGVEG